MIIDLYFVNDVRLFAILLQAVFGVWSVFYLFVYRFSSIFVCLNFLFRICRILRSDYFVCICCKFGQYPDFVIFDPIRMSGHIFNYMLKEKPVRVCALSCWFPIISFWGLNKCFATWILAGSYFFSATFYCNLIFKTKLKIFCYLKCLFLAWCIL